LDINAISLNDIKKGAFAGQLIVLRNVTERRRIEQELRESEARNVLDRAI
jgi:signal transduction histidine kinase